MRIITYSPKKVNALIIYYDLLLIYKASRNSSLLSTQKRTRMGAPCVGGGLAPREVARASAFSRAPSEHAAKNLCQNCEIKLY